MKSMMISEEEKKNMAQPSILADRPQYPYGLCVNLDPESVEKLGLGKMPQAGDKMMLLAHVFVKNVSMENNQGDEKEYSLSLQITDMDLKEHKEDKSAEDSLYGHMG